MRPMLFVVRGADGIPQAIHERIEKPDGKVFRWWTTGPDGQPVDNLQGRSSKDLPLFQTELVASWDDSQPVFICEGERDALALARAGRRALGTVTGAPACHNPEAFAILRGFEVLLWPDADQAGAEQMLKAARALDPVAASVLCGRRMDRHCARGPEHADIVVGHRGDEIAALRRLADGLLITGFCSLPTLGATPLRCHGLPS